MGWRYWAMPFTFLGALVVTLVWDIADGPDDVPPWAEEYSCD